MLSMCGADAGCSAMSNQSLLQAGNAYFQVFGLQDDPTNKSGKAAKKKMLTAAEVLPLSHTHTNTLALSLSR